MAVNKKMTGTEQPAMSGLVYDVCIIGGGVAALSAGIFTARHDRSVLIVATELGGQTASTAEIENYPGCGVVEGPDLISHMASEARIFGCDFVCDTAQSIEPDEDNGGGIVHCNVCTYRARTLIVATGKAPRRLNVPGEQELFGRGVFYAGVLNLEDFKNRRCVVVGGGSSALDAVARLSTATSQITLIHRRDTLSGEAVLQQRMRSMKSVRLFLNTQVSAILGEERVAGLRVNGERGEETLAADAVVIAIGFEPRTVHFSEVVDADAQGRIVIDHECRTSMRGIFAAGDCTTVPYQQIVISAGEGAKAALSACRYLRNKDGKRGLLVDWGYV